MNDDLAGASPVDAGVGRQTPERADPSIDWPCARLCVADDGSVNTTMYAPGLPVGEHDVWCLPVEAPWLDEWMQTADRMADLLARTAIALRGPAPAGTLWGLDDLPDRVSAAIAAIDVMQRAAAINGAAAERASVSSIDAEHMIAECVPGGSTCDPQQVADAIRRYCSAWPADGREPPNVALTGPRGLHGDEDAN